VRCSADRRDATSEIGQTERTSLRANVVQSSLIADVGE
jgi:hypothetical protein